jgi:hypothetical protein
VYVFDLVSARFSTLDEPALPSAFNDLVTDTLYVVDGTDIVPWFQGTPYTATWRSKIAVRGSKPSFGWLRLNGDFTTATVRLYLNGVLLHTDTFTNRKPKRVPVGRGREWEIEVESAGVVTSAIIATDVKELL